MIIEVANATARNALKVSRQAVGLLEVWVQDEARMYRPSAPGTGSGIWALADAGSLAVTTDITAGGDITGANVYSDDEIVAEGDIIATTGSIFASAGDISATLGAVAAGTTVTAGTTLLAPKLNSYPVNRARLQLTDAANIVTAAVANSMFYVTLTATRILDNPSGLVVGGWYSWEVIQGGAGSYELTYGNLFKFRGGAPTLTNAVGSIDVLFGYYDGVKLLMDVWLDVKA